MLFPIFCSINFAPLYTYLVSQSICCPNCFQVHTYLNATTTDNVGFRLFARVHDATVYNYNQPRAKRHRLINQNLHIFSSLKGAVLSPVACDAVLNTYINSPIVLHFCFLRDPEPSVCYNSEHLPFLCQSPPVRAMNHPSAHLQ